MDAKNFTTGERIRAFRMRWDLTQEQLAEAVGVHLTTISRWERDEMSDEIPLKHIRALARALKVTPNDLIEEQVA